MKCPICGEAAYVGFISVECSNTKCRAYEPSFVSEVKRSVDPDLFKVGDRIRLKSQYVGVSGWLAGYFYEEHRVDWVDDRRKTFRSSTMGNIVRPQSNFYVVGIAY